MKPKHHFPSSGIVRLCRVFRPTLDPASCLSSSSPTTCHCIVSHLGMDPLARCTTIWKPEAGDFTVKLHRSSFSTQIRALAAWGPSPGGPEEVDFLLHQRLLLSFLSAPLPPHRYPSYSTGLATTGMRFCQI